MPLLSKAGSLLRQTANRQSIHHAIRGTSLVGSQEALRGSSYSTDQQSLRKAFANSDEVDGKTFMDHDTGRSTGLGFFTSSAIQPLNGQELLGRQVRLNNATVRPGNNFGTGGVVDYGQLGFGVGYGLRSYRGGRTVNSIIGSADKFGVGQRRSISSTDNTGAGSNPKSGLRIAASYLPSLAVFPHITSGIENIMADYVHQKMTKEFVLLAFKLFLIIVAKDVFLFLFF